MFSSKFIIGLVISLILLGVGFSFQTMKLVQEKNK